MAYLTEGEIAVLACLARGDEMSSFEISEEMGLKRESIGVILGNIGRRFEGLIIRINDPGSNRRERAVYKIAPELQGKSQDELEKMFLEPVREKGEKRENRKPCNRALELFGNESIAKIIETNARYVSVAAIANYIGERSETVTDLARMLNISLDQEDREPRAGTISKDLPYIPLEASIEQWLGGTCIKLPSYAPGINGVTRHYSI